MLQEKYSLFLYIVDLDIFDQFRLEYTLTDW